MSPRGANVRPRRFATVLALACAGPVLAGEGARGAVPVELGSTGAQVESRRPGLVERHEDFLGALPPAFTAVERSQDGGR